jgi:hypothetical protein
MPFLVVLFFWNLFFLFYEIPEIVLLPLQYFNDTWNNVDAAKIVTTQIYLTLTISR